MGDTEFREEALTHYKRVLGYMIKYIGDKELAEDVVQDTYVKVLEANNVVLQEGKMRSWIITIAANTFLSYMSRGYGRREKMQRPIEDVDYMLANPEVPDDFTEDVERTLAAIATFKPDYQEIFHLRMNGMSYQDITIRTGLSQAQLTSKFYIGRIKLRKLLNR